MATAISSGATNSHGLINPKGKQNNGTNPIDSDQAEFQNFSLEDQSVSVFFNPLVSMRDVSDALGRIYLELQTKYKYLWGTARKQRLNLQSKVTIENNKLVVEWRFLEKFAENDPNPKIAGKSAIRGQIKHTLYPFLNTNENSQDNDKDEKQTSKSLSALILRTFTNISPIDEIIRLAELENIDIVLLNPESDAQNTSSNAEFVSFGLASNEQSAEEKKKSEEELAKLEAEKEKLRAELEAKEEADRKERARLDLEARSPLDFLPPNFQERDFARSGILYLGGGLKDWNSSIDANLINIVNVVNNSNNTDINSNNGNNNNNEEFRILENEGDSNSSLETERPQEIKLPPVDSKKLYNEHKIHEQVLGLKDNFIANFPSYLTVPKVDPISNAVDVHILQALFVATDIQSVYESDYPSIQTAGQSCVKIWPLTNLYPTNRRERGSLPAPQLQILDKSTGRIVRIEYPDEFSLLVIFKEEIDATVIHKATILFNPQEPDAKILNGLKEFFMKNSQNDQSREQRQWQNLIPSATSDSKRTGAANGDIGVGVVPNNGDSVNVNVNVNIPSQNPLTTVQIQQVSSPVQPQSQVHLPPLLPTIATNLNTNTNNQLLSAMSVANRVTTTTTNSRIIAPLKTNPSVIPTATVPSGGLSSLSKFTSPTPAVSLKPSLTPSAVVTTKPSAPAANPLVTRRSLF